MPHPPIDCRWCLKTHPATLLCEPARKYLDAIYAAGRANDVPSMEFEHPVDIGHAAGLGLGPNTELFTQFVVQGGVGTLLGVHRPVLIITGRGTTGQPLPKWVYLGDDEELTAAAKLFSDMTEMAIRRARDLREQAGR